MARGQLRKQKKRPLIVICSEGGKKSTEYYYFREFKSRNLRIQFSDGNSTDPKGMLDDLLKYIDNNDIKSEENVRIFLVIDTDLSDKRINEIKAIRQECLDNNIEIITSSPTFEIWFLMHFRKSNLRFNSSQEVKRELKKVNGSYTESMNMFNLINARINDAIDNAIFYSKQAESNKIDSIKANPHTEIFVIINAIDELNQLTKEG